MNSVVDDQRQRYLRKEMSKRAERSRLRSLNVESDIVDEPELALLTDQALATEFEAIRDVSGDDRKEVEDPRVVQQAKDVASSICAVIPVARLEERQDLDWALAAPTLADLFNVGPSEPFRQQPAAAVGTAFLLKKNMVATALHVATQVANPRDLCFVFDYVVRNEKAKTVFARKDVVFGSSIAWFHTRADIALVELQEPVEDRRTLAIQWTRIEDEERVYVIGYPVGLPAKVADNARVLRNDPIIVGERETGRFFTTDLDAMMCNSGSPVFNQENHKVVGILSQAPPGFTTFQDKLVSRFAQENDDVVVSRITNLLATPFFQ